MMSRRLHVFRLPLGARCPCNQADTSVYVYDPQGPLTTTRCRQCAEEMRTLGWLIREESRNGVSKRDVVEILASMIRAAEDPSAFWNDHDAERQVERARRVLDRLCEESPKTISRVGDREERRSGEDRRKVTRGWRASFAFGRRTSDVFPNVNPAYFERRKRVGLAEGNDG